MEIQRQYVDSHGQSEVAFAFCRLLGFELAPRLKAIARQRLYLPEAGLRAALPNLLPILSDPIDWALIERQYDEMVKHAAAMRHRTADAEARLTPLRSLGAHAPDLTRALAELGRAVKTLPLVPLPRLGCLPLGDPRGAQHRRDLEQRQRLRLRRPRAARSRRTGWRIRRSRCWRCISCKTASST